MSTKVDVIAAIKAHGAAGDPQVTVLKFKAMRASAFAFFRGTCHLFYARMPRSAHALPSPRVWACGDLHLQNFGSFKGDNGVVYFDLNDFDEALLAPAWYDALRCAASIVAAHEELHLSKEQTRELQRRFVDRYAQTLALGRAYWIECERATGRIGILMKTLRARRRRDLLAAHVKAQKNGRYKIRVDGRRALTADKAQSEFASALVAQWAKNRPDARFFDVLHVARRIAGVGSLGCERYVVLVRGRGPPDGLHLIDVKQARPCSSLAAAQVPQPMFRSEGERIVVTQRRVQARTPAWLDALSAPKRGSFVLRDLQPREDRLDLRVERTGFKGLRGAIEAMADLLAWGQIRASGRAGAASADDLAAFGASAPDWSEPFLELANACASASDSDYKAYSTAFDAGVFERRSF